MWRKLLILTLVLGLVAGFSIGFAQQEEIKIRVSGWVSSPFESKIMESMIDRYNDFFASPGVEAIYEPIPADYNTKIETMIAAGNPPDVFYWDIFAAEPLIKKSVLLPLNNLMAETYTDPADFLYTAINAFTLGGKVYGIPKDFNTLALFYNKKMFDVAGVPYPTSDWTWDDLKAAAKAIQAKKDELKADFPNFEAALAMAPDTARWMPFVFQNGGSFFNADRSKVVINSPEAVKALEFYTSFELVDGTAVRPSVIGAGWQGEAFGKENVAMVMEGGWMPPFLRDNFPDVEYGAVELPRGPVGRGNYLFTVAYVIPATTKHPEEAWSVVEYLTSLESQLFVLRTGFALPTRRLLTESPLLTKNPITYTIFKGAAYARPFEFGPLGGKAVDELAAAMESVFLGKKTAQKALDDAAATLNAEL